MKGSNENCGRAMRARTRKEEGDTRRRGADGKEDENEEDARREREAEEERARGILRSD